MIKGVTTEKIPSQKTLVRLERFLNRDCNQRKTTKNSENKLPRQDIGNNPAFWVLGQMFYRPGSIQKAHFHKACSHRSLRHQAHWPQFRHLSNSQI